MGVENMKNKSIKSVKDSYKKKSKHTQYCRPSRHLERQPLKSLNINGKINKCIINSSINNNGSPKLSQTITNTKELPVYSDGARCQLNTDHSSDKDKSIEKVCHRKCLNYSLIKESLLDPSTNQESNQPAVTLIHAATPVLRKTPSHLFNTALHLTSSPVVSNPLLKTASSELLDKHFEDLHMVSMMYYTLISLSKLKRMTSLLHVLLFYRVP